MHGGLALRSGVLFVGRHAGTARVAPFDLDGRRLSPGFTFGGGSAGRAAITGMAVDEDRRLWVADAAARCLRIFTAFGRSLGELGSEDEAGPDGERLASTDRPGDLGRPVDVAVRGADVEQELIVAARGRRRRRYGRGRPLLAIASFDGAWHARAGMPPPVPIPHAFLTERLPAPARSI